MGPLQVGGLNMVTKCRSSYWFNQKAMKKYSRSQQNIPVSYGHTTKN